MILTYYLYANIQDQITILLVGWLEDTNSNIWFKITRHIDQARQANETF